MSEFEPETVPYSKSSMGDVETTLPTECWADANDALPIASSVPSRGTSKASTFELRVERPAPSDADLSQTSAVPPSHCIRGTAGEELRSNSSGSRSGFRVRQKASLDPSDDPPCVTSSQP